jgi:prepilin-type N-terminal cleavage/methylation domain-containing protein/prepilin-type processing-associated H-X9-DG protein
MRISQVTRRGLSLIELVVVLAIVVVLSALLLPTVRQVREAARQSACASNLRQIGMALGIYRSENTDLLPPDRIDVAQLPADYLVMDPGCAFGCFWYSLPLLGQYLDIRKGGAYLKDDHQAVVCPSRTMLGYSGTSYGINVRAFPSFTDGSWVDVPGIKIPRQTTFVAFVDGGSRFHPGYGAIPPTYGVYDGQSGLDWSIGGQNSSFNWRKRHHDGANALFFDGHVSYCQNLRTEVLTESILVAP